MDDELLACGHHRAGIMRCPNCDLVVCACRDTDDPHRCLKEPIPPPLSLFGRRYGCSRSFSPSA